MSPTLWLTLGIACAAVAVPSLVMCGVAIGLEIAARKGPAGVRPDEEFPWIP